MSDEQTTRPPGGPNGAEHQSQEPTESPHAEKAPGKSFLVETSPSSVAETS
jgi:hypothetical protein